MSPPVKHGPDKPSVATRGCTARSWSTPDPQLLDKTPVARLVGAPEIVEQLATLRHELEQPAARVIVLDVGLEMIGQVVDPFGEDRDLHFRRTSVAGLRRIRLDNVGLAAGSNRHRLTTFLKSAASN